MTCEPTPEALEAVARAIHAKLAPFEVFGEDISNAKFVREAAPSVIAAYEAAQWQPIETAPKDEFVLVVSEGRVHTATLFEPIGWLEADMAQLWDVTHWRPLPPPPT